MRTAHVLAAVSVLVAVVAGAPGVARAQPSEIEACATAAEESQPLRNAGKLAAAREKLLVCARPVCPGAVQRDCTRWLADVERVLPSIVLRVTDAGGKDITRVKVSVDGAVLTEKLDGRPIPIDPGEHALRYEADGQEPVTETLLIRQGGKDRLVSAAFGKPKDKAADGASAPAATAAPTSAPPPADTATREGGGIPTISWVLGGAGVVALGVGTIMWVSGTADHSDMESGCAKTQTCPQADVDSAKGKLLLGDVAVGLGLVAIGAAVVIAVTSKSAPATPPAASKLDVRMLDGGGVATFRARF